MESPNHGLADKIDPEDAKPPPADQVEHDADRDSGPEPPPVEEGPHGATSQPDTGP